MQRDIELDNVFIGLSSRVGGMFQTWVGIARRLLPIAALPLLSVTSAALGQESATDLIDKVANLEILFCESASSEPMLVSFIFGGEKGPVAVGLGSEAEIRLGDNSWTVIAGTDVTVFAWPDAPDFTVANFTAIRDGVVVQGRCSEIAKFLVDILKLVSLSTVGKGAMELKIEELQAKIVEMEGEASMRLADFVRCQGNMADFAALFEVVFSAGADLFASQKYELQRGLNEIQKACSTPP